LEIKNINGANNLLMGMLLLTKKRMPTARLDQIHISTPAETRICSKILLTSKAIESKYCGSIALNGTLGVSFPCLLPFFQFSILAITLEPTYIIALIQDNSKSAINMAISLPPDAP
jgi:hypothetical protein